MSIRIEWDAPDPSESVPFGDLVTFVERAHALGAEANTPVLAATAPQDDLVITAFRVELDAASAADRPSFVCLDRSDVADAIAVLEAIEDNEGDARMQLAAVRELRQRLTKLAIE
jgi:hypothetical protein